MSASDGWEAQLCFSIQQKEHGSKLICHLQNHNPNKCFITRCHQLSLGPWQSPQAPNLIRVPSSSSAYFFELTIKSNRSSP